MERYDYIVLGAGVAGLSFGHKAAKAGKSVLVLEKDDKIGGLARTIEHKGFLLDYCAHRFHTKNKEVMDEVSNLVGPSFLKHIKRSRIYMFNKYLKYPFELQNLLRAMPITQSGAAGFSFLYNKAKSKLIKKKDIVSYKDWFEFYFGKKLYEIMCYPYTSKIWHMDPAEISADWAEQRFQGVNIIKLIKTVYKKLVTLDFTSYSLEEDSYAPDGGIFYYPENGFKTISERFAEEIAKNGSKIHTKADITSISENDKIVNFIIDDKEHKIKANEAIISTIPLHALTRLLNRKDENIAAALNQLKYMDIIFVYLFVNKPKISNDHWLYFPDADIIFNRAVEFSNWSPKMCPKGKTSLCLDITCFKNDSIWNMTDEKIVEQCIFDCNKIDLVKKEEVFDSFVVRIRNAYPVYDIGYKERLTKIVRYIEQNKKIYCLGRTGIFRYHNSDGSIEMGFELAKNLLKGNKEFTLLGFEPKEYDL